MAGLSWSVSLKSLLCILPYLYLILILGWWGPHVLSTSRSSNCHAITSLSSICNQYIRRMAAEHCPICRGACCPPSSVAQCSHSLSVPGLQLIAPCEVVTDQKDSRTPVWQHLWGRTAAVHGTCHRTDPDFQIDKQHPDIKPNHSWPSTKNETQDPPGMWMAQDSITSDLPSWESMESLYSIMITYLLLTILCVLMYPGDKELDTNTLPLSDCLVIECTHLTAALNRISLVMHWFPPLAAPSFDDFISPTSIWTQLSPATFRSKYNLLLQSNYTTSFTSRSAGFWSQKKTINPRGCVLRSSADIPAP